MSSPDRGDLAGLEALVTGGASGIGLATARLMAARGARVAILDREIPPGLASDQTLRPVVADVTDDDAVRSAVAAVTEGLDGLDILVNNAAMEFQPRPIAETSEELYDTVMAVNARSVFVTVRYAARAMRDNGRIINISTLNTTRPAPGNVAYVASKGALEQITKAAAAELGARGITVNAVCPGATDTDLLRHTNAPAALVRVARSTPLRRLGEPADVADVVAMLASPSGRWITGQVINATGGL